MQRKKYLSSLSYNKENKTLKKNISKEAEKAKESVNIPGKVPRISVKLPEAKNSHDTEKLKAVTFKPVKIATPKQNKVKLPTIQDYKNILKVAK